MTNIVAFPCKSKQPNGVHSDAEAIPEHERRMRAVNSMRGKMVIAVYDVMLEHGRDTRGREMIVSAFNLAIRDVVREAADPSMLTAIREELSDQI